MKKINMILLSLIIICGVTERKFAEDLFSETVPYVRHALGARALSLGGTGLTLLNDATATYWNPAGLAKIKIGDFVGMSTNTFFLGTDFLGSDDKYESSTGYYFLAVAAPYYKGGLGANIYFFGTDMLLTDETYPDKIARNEESGKTTFHFVTATTLSYGFNLKEKLSVGANFKINFFYGGQSLEQTDKHTDIGVATDIGTIWQTPFERLKIGGILKHIGTDLRIKSVKLEKEGAKSKESLPHTIATGLCYDLIKNERHRISLVGEPYFIWGKAIKSGKKDVMVIDLKNMVVEEEDIVDGKKKYYYEDKHFGTQIKSEEVKGEAKDVKIMDEKSPYYGCLKNEKITEDFKKALQPELEKRNYYWHEFIAEYYKDRHTPPHFGIAEKQIVRSYVYGINAGVEYSYIDTFFIRVGRTNTLRELDPKASTLTYGIGINLKNKYNLDYANIPWGMLRSHVFSLSIKFGGTAEKE